MGPLPHGLERPGQGSARMRSGELVAPHGDRLQLVPWALQQRRQVGAAQGEWRGVLDAHGARVPHPGVEHRGTRQGLQRRARGRRHGGRAQGCGGNEGGLELQNKGTSVKLCRFGNWTDRASEFDEGFTFSKIRVVYYGLQMGLFSRESMEAVVAPPKPEEPSAEAPARPDMQNRNAPLQRFRAAAKGNIQLAAILMSDPACRMKARMCFVLIRPIREWYGRQSQALRSVDEHRVWLKRQVDQHFAEPLQGTFKQLMDSEILDFLGFVLDFGPLEVAKHKHDPVTAGQDGLARLAGIYTTTLVACRPRRLMYLTHGWTGQQVRLLGPDEQGAKAAAQELLSDFRAFTESEARADAFWRRLSKRSVFRTVPVQQLVALLRDTPGEVSQKCKQVVFNRVSTIGQSKVCEDGMNMGRRLEHSAANKRHLPQGCFGIIWSTTTWLAACTVATPPST